MTKAIKAVLYSSLGIGILCVAFTSAVQAQEDKTFRARIGLMVRSGDRTFQAKTHGKLNPGDLIRIYVHPETSSFVYVIHTDPKNRKVTLLNMTEQRIHSCMLVLPSIEEYYQVDGDSDTEVFTIICSPSQMQEFAGGQIAIEYDKWKLLEKDLVERSSIQMAETVDRPFPIIGNVRAMKLGGGYPPVPIFSGKEFLVKRFEFQVRSAASR
jgi:hypothetical protein